jgi:hypothetical protein
MGSGGNKCLIIRGCPEIRCKGYFGTNFGKVYLYYVNQ